MGCFVLHTPWHGQLSGKGSNPRPGRSCCLWTALETKKSSEAGLWVGPRNGGVHRCRSRDQIQALGKGSPDAGTSKVDGNSTVIWTSVQGTSYPTQHRGRRPER